MTTLRVWHLYPSDMNIYGDRGNVISIVQRCRWRGIDVQVQALEIGGRLGADACDLVFGGGGQDNQQFAVARDLAGPNGEALRRLAEDDAPMLLICGTYQLFGAYFRTGSGEEIRGIELLDLHTVAGPKRMIGDALIRADDACADNHERTLVGFENHSGQTFLGPRCRPLGRTIVGGGNNGRDGGEGAIYREVHGSYLHGPLLPKNPWLTDHLIASALRRRGVAEPLPPIDDSAEVRAHVAMSDRIRRRGSRSSGVV